MEHDIDALATLHSIHAIPYNSHDCPVEGWPPSSKDTERSTIENGISSLICQLSAANETRDVLHMILGSGSAIQYDHNSDQGLSTGGTTN